MGRGYRAGIYALALQKWNNDARYCYKLGPNASTQPLQWNRPRNHFRNYFRNHFRNHAPTVNAEPQYAIAASNTGLVVAL